MWLHFTMIQEAMMLYDVETCELVQKPMCGLESMYSGYCAILN